MEVLRKLHAPRAAVDVLGAAVDIGLRDTGPPLPDPEPGPPPPPLYGDPVVEPGVDGDTSRAETFLANSF